MQLNAIKKPVIILTMMLLFVKVDAQNALFQKIANAHKAGIEFNLVKLFKNATGNIHEDVLSKAVLLQENTAEVSALYQSHPAAVSIEITTADGAHTIEMVSSYPLAANAEIGYIDASGMHTCSYDAGVHYQGIVMGSEKSMASMSVFADGTIMMLFGNEKGNFVIGKLEDGTGNYILYNDRDMKVHNTDICHVMDSKPQGAANDMARTTGFTTCKKVRAYWECDYDLNVLKGGFSSTQVYLTGLFNQMQALYANENVAVELSSLYIWTVQDTYNSSIGSNEVFPFMAYWNTRGNSFNGDVAMLITHDGGGGIAALNGINTRQYAYGYSGLTGTYSTVPTYSWDVTTPTHEMGHQCGLNHTHNCIWRTGPGGTCGAIDNCYSIESSSGCTTCGSTDSVAKGGFTGTIMSYCHLVPIGINLANGFGTLPGNALRTDVASCGNLSSIISVNLTTTPICNTDGAINLSFNSNNMGTAPYTYLWSGGKTTASISGLSLPGTYILNIKDSNNCSGSFTVTLTKQATPGNGISPNFQPICCKDTSFTYTITASAPANLLSCHTVAWLRTTSALTTYSAAQTAFNTASASDIIYSTNSNSINSATAAQLNIPSPTPCAVQSYYYTPFISKKGRAAVDLNDSNTTVGSVSTGTAQIGNFTTLSNQSSIITICDANDTMTSGSLKVIVSGYTGRANHMTISVQNSAGAELYVMNGLAGNGTYTMPVKAGDNLLQYLKVSAYDLNYKNADTAYASSVTVKTVRKVSYPAILQPTFENVCSTGTSAHLSFAPTGCIKLDASNLKEEPNSFSVFPNPACGIVTITFTEHSNGNGILMLTDVLGKAVMVSPVRYTVGKNEMPISVLSYPKGIYLLSYNNEAGNINHVKLVVEK